MSGMKPTRTSPTVIVDSYRELGKHGIGTEKYRGLGIYAAPGLHEFVAGKLLEKMATGSSVLELGAGSGAMSLRLADMGYKVTSTDILEDNFQATADAKFIVADLNSQFAADMGTFDAVMAMEIIEHLENPRNFLRQCRACLGSGGLLILSTPNLANPLSRVMFMTHGCHQWFEDKNYHSIGHIMPLSPWLLSHCFDEAGFVPEWIGSHGDIEKNLSVWPRMRWLVRGLRYLSRVPRELDGEIYVAVLRVKE